MELYKSRIELENIIIQINNHMGLPSGNTLTCCEIQEDDKGTFIYLDDEIINVCKELNIEIE